MFSPLVNYTHYSLQYGFSKPHELVKLCNEYGFSACGITDLNTLSGIVEFYQECKKGGIKPIIGMSIDSNNHVFAKNTDGIKELILFKLGKGNEFNNLIYLTDKPSEFQKGFKDVRINDGSINPSYYCKPEDYDVHRVSVASGLKTTIREGKNSIYSKFFISDDYYIPYRSPSSDLIESIVDSCEDYDLIKPPSLPHFPTLNGMPEKEMLKQICRDGWRDKIIPIIRKDSSKKQIYLDRFNKELDVIDRANLFGYFLIVWDILNFIRSSGWLPGPGRGSASGCLISYLMGITTIDPIKYDLLFERFYNDSRNTEGNVSLPDIDIDVPSTKRDQVVNYIKDKYGHDKVAQICTFSRLQGRSVIKEVLRVNESCSFTEMNAMTKYIPDEAAISDELEKMDESERSIIRWALINRKQYLEPFCSMDENGNLHGDYAEQFDQAIRLEGTFKNVGTHAAGIVISSKPLIEICPVSNVAEMEMSALESMGLVKLDILGVAVLSKLMRIEELINEKD
jgi:DNA polymerase-3 subunit alpha